MWTYDLLNALCTCLPIVAFASPATIFLPVFCPNTLLCVRKNLNSCEDIAFQEEDRTPALIEMPPLVLTAQMTSCYLFAIYAFHLHMWTLLTPNLAGFVLGFLWSSLYPLKVSSEKSLLKQWKIQYVLSLLFMIVGSFSIKKRPYLSSSIAAAIGAAMSASPLPVILKSYNENNPELLGSLSMNIAMLTCCSVWVIHSSSLVEYDMYVLLTNAVGVIVQSTALIIRCAISNVKKDTYIYLNEGTSLLC